MPKLNFGMADAADIAASQGYEQYKGELPPNGAYQATVKVVKVRTIASGNDKGKNRLQITAIIDDPEYPEYKGCPAFGNLNITDQGVPFVNQFLESLTDGSDSAKAAIRKAFWKTGPIVDDNKEHIVRVGKAQVNSPHGEIQVVVGTKQSTYNGDTSVRIQQWMLAGEAAESDDDDDDDSVVEASDVAEVDSDDEGDYEDDDAEGDDGDAEDPYAEDTDSE